MNNLIENNKKDYKVLREKFKENHEKIINFILNFNEYSIKDILYVNSDYSLKDSDSFNKEVFEKIENLNLKEKLGFSIGGSILILYSYQNNIVPCIFNSCNYYLNIENDYVFSRMFKFALLNEYDNTTTPFDFVCSNMFELHTLQKRHWGKISFSDNEHLKNKPLDSILKQYYNFFSNIILNESIGINNIIDKKLINDYLLIYELNHDVNLNFNLTDKKLNLKKSLT